MKVINYEKVKGWIGVGIKFLNIIYLDFKFRFLVYFNEKFYNKIYRFKN